MLGDFVLLKIKDRTIITRSLFHVYKIISDIIVDHEIRNTRGIASNWWTSV